MSSSGRPAGRAAIGLDAEVIGPAEARALMPAISPESLYGAVYLRRRRAPRPARARRTRVADAARALGVRIRQGCRVTGFELSAAARDHGACSTDAGPIDTELVVNAAGHVGAAGRRDGRRVHPVDAGRPPAHRAARPCPGHELPRDMPCFRDPDNLVYGKSEHGGMVFGGYELDPRVPLGGRRAVGPRGARSLPPDFERFAPLMAGAIRRFPFLADAEAIRLVCHPDAMTPDANPLLGPDARRARLLGRGRAVAQRVRRRRAGSGGRWPAGSRRATRAWTSGRTGRGGSRTRIATPSSRRASLARHTPTTTGCATRSTPRWRAGRGACRRSTAGSQDAGAVFGTKAGWERADLPSTRAAVAARRPRPGGLRLGTAALVRAGRAEEPRGPRAGGHRRPELVRQDRRRRVRARSGCSSGSARTTSTGRSAASSTRRGATSAAGWSPTSRSRASRTTASGS